MVAKVSGEVAAPTSLTINPPKVWSPHPARVSFGQATLKLKKSLDDKTDRTSSVVWKSLDGRVAHRLSQRWAPFVCMIAGPLLLAPEGKGGG